MRYIVLILLALLSYSCSNELDVIEDKKDIPIVYGFLSASDTAQYIRIERAFVDQSISALDLAQIADSVYYKDLIVTIQNMETGVETNLDRVDGNLEGYQREEGAFVKEPNYLYKVNTESIEFDDTHNYQLRIQRNDPLPLVTAETSLVGESRLITPNPLSPNPVIDFNDKDKTTFSWGRGNNATVYDIYVDFNYDERPIGGSYESRELTWKVASNVTSVLHKQDGTEFFLELARVIPEDSNIERRFRGVDIIIVAGNSELREYLRVGQANLGITSTQDVPVFTNLSEGRGIFASKYTSVLEGIKISPRTLDSLANSNWTKQLNFRI